MKKGRRKGEAKQVKRKNQSNFFKYNKQDQELYNVDKLSNSEAMLNKKYNIQNRVYDILICTDVKLMDFQKLREDQLKTLRQLYDVLMMDPPRQLSSSQPSRGVAIAYQFMTDENIRKMPIETLQENGIILIWKINTKYKVTCKQIEQWGYNVIDEIKWCKKTVNWKIAKGHGFYLQHAKENWHKRQSKFDPNRLRQDVTKEVKVRNQKKYIDILNNQFQIVIQHYFKGYYLQIIGRRNNVRENRQMIGNEL
ncbi:unnamed protein product (macronuclear) [Paramecium tetraurelia]|uniref:mRNA m(6)A methyltransferase n=1 Tax=Paramecium tetraurelia TaxID=5888 RepID=A0BAR7_PARTE|nr:uncharacterized protein GSPATT00000069001 [Paramecium tetraurelia]CAK55634.1 unnamed protein product [Paramecium tetraurelia]|eukprot:XP_001423032.1 hypothetical protein (macronuclear) [Paramecium tetraurelia strain d4-2]